LFFRYVNIIYVFSDKLESDILLTLVRVQHGASDVPRSPHHSALSKRESLKVSISWNGHSVCTDMY